jgi:hypothetical protein
MTKLAHDELAKYGIAISFSDEFRIDGEQFDFKDRDPSLRMAIPK